MSMVDIGTGYFEEPIVQYFGWEQGIEMEQGSFHQVHMNEDACGNIFYTIGSGKEEVLHREVGPAVCWADGSIGDEYWIKGEQLTEEQFEEWYTLNVDGDGSGFAFDTHTGYDILMEF